MQETCPIMVKIEPIDDAQKLSFD